MDTLGKQSIISNVRPFLAAKRTLQSKPVSEARFNIPVGRHLFHLLDYVTSRFEILDL